ncbi:uncharacterized protein LOC144194199 [Stigmatopora nigra]
MDGQGDGDHNGPNRYRTSIPVGDLPPTDDSDEEVDDDDDRDDVGDEDEDMESVFLMHLFVNQYMQFFVNPRAQLPPANSDNGNHVSESPDADDIADCQEESDVPVMSDAESRVEEDPQPGPSRNRCGEGDEDEDEMRSSSKYFRWWHEFDNSSDGSTDLDNDEQDPAPCATKKRSRDDLDGNLRLQGDLSHMTMSAHHVHGTKKVNDERSLSKVGDFQSECAEDPLITYADEKARENYDKENKCGKKRFKR